MQLPTNDLGTLQQWLDDAGAAGWEVCGVAYLDRTIGFNSVLAVLKRPSPKRPAPTSRDPAWHDDPYGAHSQRYWNGHYWTQHVMRDDGTQAEEIPCG